LDIVSEILALKDKRLTIGGFRHQSPSDIKVGRLGKRHGNKGYAAYHKILEELCRSGNFQLDLNNEWMGEDLTFACGLDSEPELIEIIESCVEIKLFDADCWNQRKIIFSRRLVEENKSEILRGIRALRQYAYSSKKSEVYERDGFKCVYCGSTGDLSIDHVTPLSRGCSDDIENLATACRACNSSKGAKSLEDWLGGAL
jgi:5-methylcytosine-specific restriction endonuclease McrA